MDQTSSTYHEPVMVHEVVHFMEPVAVGIIVDGTFGGGGHALALLHRFPELAVIGIDRDPDAIANAPVHPRLSLVQANFAELAEVVAGERGTDPPGGPHVDGVLLDLGISSHQVDEAARGFAFSADGPLDMRMDASTGETAAELIDRLDVQAITDLLRAYGDEPRAWPIANAIVEHGAFATTG
ncbi:MAG: 16S rRNA (cytosine(1402)-N(4))-methyltransferase, partial [Acidobacteria bacterium]|nr:16S rRNA (cytosine(1402)-N(4))-methyltransferase [Acidobacteriota bacterium]